MSNEYINMIEERLLEMRAKAEKKLDPVGNADADIDNDGDVDASDKYLKNRRKAIKKSMGEEGEKMTPCPKCEGSTDNHDPECPDCPDNKGSKEEGCGDYGKKMKKEEVEQVDEAKAPSTVKFKGKTYYQTGKTGKDAKTGAPSFEYSSDQDGNDDRVFYNATTKKVARESVNQSVTSMQWGFGEVIETTEEGLNVCFEHGVEFNIPAEELTFVQESADRAKHYKGAAKPETMLDKYKGAGAKKMAADNNVGSPKEAEITPEEEGHQDAVKAGKSTKQAPTRGGEPRKGDLKIVNPVKENYRTLATKGMGAETKKSINVGRQVDYFHPSNGDKKQGTISKIHATGYHVKDDDDGKTHKFTFHDRAKAKDLLS